MGRQKELYTQTLENYNEKEDIIEYKGSIYKNYSNNNGYVEYSLIICPLCGEKILKKYEKDETPGFKDKSIYIEDKLCECDLKTYYKEKEPYFYVRC